MKHETTLDDVLEAVNAGFTQVQVQIHGLDGRVQGLEGRMDKLEGRMGKLEDRMGNLEHKVESLDRKIDTVKVELKADIAILAEHMGGFAAKQVKFEVELATERAARERLEARMR